MFNETFKKIFKGKTSYHLFKTFCVYIFISLSLIVIKVLIARFYGIEELGIFTYFFSLVSLVSLFSSFGLPEAITQTIIKEPHKLRRAIQNYLWIIPITALVLIATILITSYTKLNPKITNFNLAIILFIIAYSLHYLTYSILRGREKFVEASLYSLLGRIIFIGFIVLFFFLGAPFIIVLLSWSVSLLIIGIAAWSRIHGWLKRSYEEVPLKGFLVLAFSLFLMQVSFNSSRFIDVLIIKYLVDFTSLGVYSAYSSITNVINMIASVLPVVVLPLAAVNNYKLRQSFFKILLALIPFAIITSIAAYILVPLFYGVNQEFYLILALVAASSLLVVYSYFNSVFVGENKLSKFYLGILGTDFVLSLILNTGLSAIFILKWGIIGAPIAAAITILVKIGLNVYAIKRLRATKSI